MSKIPGRAAACAALLLMQACGGGDTGGSGGDNPGVPLASKSDALRELGMSSQAMFLLEDVVGDIDSGGGSGGGGVATPPKALDGQRSCDAGGSSTLATGSGVHSYARFGQSAETPYEEVTDRQCKIVYNNGALLVTYEGYTETGRSGTLGDGSQLAYAIVGSSADPYEERHEDRDSSNTTIRTVTEQLSGTTEARIGSSSTDIRSVALYQLSDSRNNYTARVAIGSDAQPFSIVNAAGQKLNGTYGYRSSSCSGG
ncbi:MAG TPA: hypothetical protein VLI06_05945, partial [Solimonas sp.]|nr:hypothetical protein [Solimonas sp.]